MRNSLIKHCVVFLIFSCYSGLTLAEENINQPTETIMGQKTESTTKIETYLVNAFCNNNMLGDFEIFLQKLALYGLKDPPRHPTINYAQQAKSELDSLWNEAYEKHQIHLSPLLEAAHKENTEYQIDSEKIINKAQRCKTVTDIEYYDTKIDKILYQINDRYLPIDS